MGALVAANSATVGAGAGGGGADSARGRLNELIAFHANPRTRHWRRRCAASACCSGSARASISTGWFAAAGWPRGACSSWVIVLGPLLVAAATAFGFLALHDVADAFFASGPRTAARASQLIGFS